MQFDFISKYYDTLNKLVFGSLIHKAKTSLFGNVVDGSKILFVGGGSGLSLVELLNNKPNLKIDFVDASPKMIAMAKTRIKEHANVDFHQVEIELFEGTSYDYIITEFFFDLFDENQVKQILDRLIKKLNRKGVWIDTDFRKPQNFRTKLILKLMYLFFKITSNLKTNELVATQHLFVSRGFKIKKEVKFSSNFISSRLIAGL